MFISRKIIITENDGYNRSSSQEDIAAINVTSNFIIINNKIQQQLLLALR